MSTRAKIYRGEHLGDVFIWMGQLVPDNFQEFNCPVSITSMLAQIAVLPDFASAVAVPASAQ